MKKKVRKTLRRRIPSPRYLGALLVAGAQSIGRGLRKTDTKRYLGALLVAGVQSIGRGLRKTDTKRYLGALLAAGAQSIGRSLRKIDTKRYLDTLLVPGTQSIGRSLRKTDTKRYLSALLVVAWAGCNTPSAPPAPERFGDPYDILTNLAPHAPDEPPAIVSDSLSALVTYAGGCAEHTFEAHARVTGRAAAILLRHDNGGDACEASLHDRIVLPLPANVLESPEIHLLHPKGGDPFILRWTPSQDEGTH